jgi:hypothetical protein
LGLFGGISLLGEGWHSVVGHAFHGHASHARAHCHAAHSGCGHACQAHPHKRHGDHDGAPDSDSIAAVHDCPICSFFAQAQLSAGIVQAELATPCFALSPPVAASPWVAPRGLYQSRGPPGATLHS